MRNDPAFRNSISRELQRIFAVGAITYVLFVLGRSTGQSYRPELHDGADLDPAYAPVRGA